ncbi:MAG: hypothetical protein ABIT05_04895 [Chitinophagaceae bacterium]
MKNYCILLSIVLLTSCNSKSKTEEKTTSENDTTALTPPTTNGDTAVSTTPPPSGKIDIESFGGIKLGMTYKELVAALGQPGRKGNAVNWAADGLEHQDWTYPAEGLVLNVSFEKDALLSTGKLFTITAKDPNWYKTAAGMRIGSTYSEVEQAYKKDIDPEATDKTQITVGSIYGGIIFSFKNDKVEKIFLGAEAE